MNTLRFMGVNRDTTTAGPGKRLEFFTKGCIRGVISPCLGCFNESTWTFEGEYRGLTVNEVIEICDTTAWNRLVTFCGGEPILQARLLTEVAKKLKEMDSTFHFVMYTAYKLDTLMKYGLNFTWVPKYGEAMKEALIESCHSYVSWPNKIEFTILTPNDVLELMKYIDLIVDGDYQYDKRLTTQQYMHEGWFVGSSNQRVIFAPLSQSIGKLQFLYADKYNDEYYSYSHCKCCGSVKKTNEQDFCSKLCKHRFNAKEQESLSLGGI